MYNETHDDETYDDYVTWEDDRLLLPSLQIHQILAVITFNLSLFLTGSQFITISCIKAIVLKK